MSIDTLIEARARAWDAAKALLDSADAEGRADAGETESAWQKAMTEVDSLDARIKQVHDAEQRRIEAEQREVEVREARSRLGIATASQSTPAPTKDEGAELRSFLRGDAGKSFEVERRDITKGSTGAPVPTSFYDRLVMHMVQVGPMLELATVLNTASGENLQIPRTTAFSTAALTSEGSAISESDPTFGAFVTLGAYKYGFTLQVSREMVEDQGVDLLGFVAEQSGIAIGVALNTVFTVGDGSSKPRGITIDTTGGVTGATSVAGVFTADNLIDLVYSVNPSYRRLPGTAWMMRDSSIATTRKLKDSQNRYLFEPSLQAGTPDTLLGFPLYSNPDVAATATSAKSVVFGNIPRYYVRQAGNVRLDRSDEFAFTSDLITFRATVRADGALVDTTGACKHFVGGAS